MGECPFCKVQIDEEILIYGGTCPTCLIEIPGEESATDPGGTPEPTETTRAILESHGMNNQSSKVLGGVAAAVVLLGIGVVWMVSSGSDSAVHTEEADTPSHIAPKEPLSKVQQPDIEPTGSNIEQSAESIGQQQEQATESKTVAASAESNKTVSQKSSQQTSSSKTSLTTSDEDSKPKTKQVGSYIYQDSKREAIGQSGPASPQEIKEAYKSILRSEGLGCVQRVAEDGEQPRGDLEFQYTVKTDGTVTGRQVRTSEGLSDQRLLNCFETALNLKVKKYRPIEEQMSVSLRFSY